MIDEHRKIILAHIKESQEFLEKFSDFEIESNFQLSLSQLDLFKVVAGLVIAISGIGYFFDEKLNTGFLIVSFVCALVTLLFSVSYTREAIDLQSKQNKSTHKMIKSKMDEGIHVALDSLKKGNSDIFFDYAKKNSSIIYPEPQLNYSGEIIVLLLYSSIGFLVLSFLAYKYAFPVLSYQTALVLIFAYVLGFKDWSIRFLLFLSKNVF